VTTDTLPGVLRAAAERHADRPAYVDGDRVVSFAELLALVQATARGYASLGFGAGDRLVLWAPNSIEWVVAALATSYAGGTLVPANSRYTAHEVADIIERTDARLVVLADGFLDRTQLADLTPLAPGRTLIDITQLPSSDGPDVEARADAITPDDVADILFTSGTTGKPKGAMSAHRQTIGVARSWAEVAGIRPDDRYLVVNPFFHSFGYKIGIVVGLLTGSTLYPVATFDLDETMSLIERAGITVFPGAPAIFQSMLAVDRSGHDLSSLRLAVTGAAMIPVVLIERMKDELGFDDVLTAFGMTEAVVVTMCRQGDDAETIANTSGRAVPGMETRIASDSGREGELLIRGDNVMLGYLDDPEATAAAIDADGWLHSGDVGMLDDAGNLKITDRLKDMYISGGFNVYPAEVEQTLLRADGVQDVAVIGVPDERLGEVGKAFVVGTASDDELLAFAKERLANFKIPRHIERIDVLPRNLSGKVLKNELRNR